MSKIDEAGLEREIGQWYVLVEEAWRQRNYIVWMMASAWLAGRRGRLWLVRRGVDLP